MLKLPEICSVPWNVPRGWEFDPHATEVSKATIAVGASSAGAAQLTKFPPRILSF